ncbi:aminopeptidase P family N-terminal domain-containing protein [Falsigemmobacter intermedius]|uniref:aminopeptidase P family N-terminal domain-containing protein n=1 Tax=Falsigemmobacter intermedius TaxID=1553448 RepID=UPI001F4FBAEF|nr:aminopeptidase P family N-terminal domain-containing protein [Falsigemmobacter intermedius]
MTDQLQGRDAVFPAAEFEGRIAKLQSAVAALGTEALILTGPENIFWACGRQTASYFAFQALVVRASAPPVLLVRQLETTGARASTWLADIRAWQDGEDPARALAALLSHLGLRHVAVERTAWFVSQTMAAQIEAALEGVTLIDGSGLTERLRAVKSPAELAAIRLAAGYAQAGIVAAIDACGSGPVRMM